MSMSYTPPVHVAARAGEAGQAAESRYSAVSWSSILAGAFVAIGMTIVMTVLASGLGLSSLSAFRDQSASATTLGVGAMTAIIVVQWISSGMGGFIAGRLRTQSVNVHNHEVFFRDTAHGFVAWAIATLLTGMILASAASSIVGGGVRAAATVAGGAVRAAGDAAGPAMQAAMGQTYTIDRLLRTDRTEAGQPAADPRAEVARILATGMRDGGIAGEDRDYLVRMIAARTGLSQDEARKRVDGFIEQAKAEAEKVKQTADTARKAAARISLLTALSMLIGAFIASTAAAYGGQLRDEY